MPAAPADALEMKMGVEIAAARIDAAEEERRRRAAAGRDDPLRNRLLQRAEDHVGDARARLGVAAGDRRRKGAIDDRARRGNDRDGPVAPFVARDRGIGQVQDRVVDRRGRHRVDGVDRPHGLRRRAGEVGDDLLIENRQAQPHRVRAIGDAVVLDDVFEL